MLFSPPKSRLKISADSSVISSLRGDEFFNMWVVLRRKSREEMKFLVSEPKRWNSIWSLVSHLHSNSSTVPSDCALSFLLELNGAERAGRPRENTLRGRKIGWLKGFTASKHLMNISSPPKSLLALRSSSIRYTNWDGGVEGHNFRSFAFGFFLFRLHHSWVY